MSFHPSSILISRTDAIGDVVLTLPVARVLKEHFPEATIGFLAKPYTHPVLEACPDVDEILSPKYAPSAPGGVTELAAWAKWEKWDAIIHVFPDARIAAWAKDQKIPARVGTTNRLYHWWTCNRLVGMSRKRSDLHEAQLNLKLLKGLGINKDYSLDALRNMTLLTPRAPLPDWLRPLCRQDAPNIILHATSMGSAREWGLANFQALAEQLHAAEHTVFITGTAKDSAILQPMLTALGSRVHDVSSKLSLAELITFTAACDGLVAGSTGPLHIAAALGTAAIGLYPAERPMHAGRWAPLGKFATTLTASPIFGENKNVLDGISSKDVFAALMRMMERQSAERG